MLSSHRCHTTLPVLDMERAVAFYRDKLGLEVDQETEGGMFFGAGAGTRIALFQSVSEERGGHTQCGWDVDDLASEVAELKSRGVVFEEYDYPSLKTVDGIAEMPHGRAAWFHDTEGNLLGLVELKG